MTKRALQAALILCAVITSAALWARQQSAPPAKPSEIQHRVEQYLRQYYAWGPAYTVKADPPTASPIPDVYQVQITISYQGESDHALVYVTHDGHYLIRGALDSLLGNPFAANIAKLNVSNQPSVGPAKACVNVVEFSDFECPHCKEAYGDLQTIEAKYPQVRFTFMDFPLTELHPWAMTAALAARCAYQQDPAAYRKLQKAIFVNQAQIVPANAFEKITGFATQAGLNVQTLQACISSPATKKLVQADMTLGGELGVNSTPTIFVNGRPMVGGNAEILDQFISYELAQCKNVP